MGKIIDAHAHACGEYLTSEKILKKLNAAGCDMVVLTPGQYGSKVTYGLKNLATKHPYDDVVSKNNKTTRLMIKLIRAIKDIPKGNEYVWQLKKELPEKVLQSYWITKANVMHLEQDYERMHFDLVKMHQCWEDFEVGDDYFCKAAMWAEQNNVPMFIHIYNQTEMKKLILYIKEHPNMKFIIGHLYCLELFLEGSKEAFRNVYFDLSNGYFVSKERIMLGYSHFGAEHFLLGSDTPYGKKSLELTLSMIKKLDITEEDSDKICGLNILKLLGRSEL